MSLIPSVAPDQLAPSQNAPIGGGAGLAVSPNAPLGATSQPAANTNLPSNATAAANAAPKLTPDAVVGVAKSSSTPVDAAVNASLVTGYDQASKIGTMLTKLTPKDQLQLWNLASPSLKSIVAASGYTPPSAQQTPEASGWWHDVLSVGDATKHAVYATADKALGTVNYPFATGWNAVDHLLRAGMYNGQMAALSSQNPSSTSAYLHMLDPTTFMQAWHATTKGATSYQPEVLKYLTNVEGFDGQTLHLAMLAASGLSLQQVLQGVPKGERANAYAMIEKQGSKFTDAVSLLADSHLSFGQAVFGGLTGSQAHQLWPRTSTGQLDATAMAGDAVTAVGTAAMAATGDEPGAAGLGGAAEGAGLLARARGALSTVKSLALNAGAAAQATGAIAGQLEGKTPDQATSITPFGQGVHPLSGIADGLTSWYLNPLFMGMKTMGAFKYEHALAIHDAMSGPDAVQAAYTNDAAYNRYANRFAQAITQPWRDYGMEQGVTNAAEHGLAEKPNLGALQTSGLPSNADLNKLYSEFYPEIRDAVATKDPQQIGAAVGKMLGSDQAGLNLMRGKFSYYYKDRTLFPKVGLPQVAVEKALGIGRQAWGGGRVDIVKQSPTQLLEDVIGRSAARDIASAQEAERAGTPMSRFMRHAVNLVGESTLDLTDPNSSANLQRVLAYALDRRRIGDIISAYDSIDPGLVGQRRDVAQAAIMEMVRTAIDHGNPNDQKYLDELLSRQKYAFGTGAEYVNPANPTGPRDVMAMDPTQTSNLISVPKYSEIYRFGKKAWYMRLFNVMLNNEAVDRFMSAFWKPALLLRPGFGLRVAGEEMANFMLRNGFSNYLRSRVAASLTDAAAGTKEWKIAKAELEAKALSGDQQAINQWDALRARSSVLGHIPDEVQANIKTAKQLISNWAGWHTLKWVQRAGDAGLTMMRAVGKDFVGENFLTEAQNLHEFGVLDSSYADHVSMSLQHTGGYNADMPNVHDAHLLRLEDGQPLRLIRQGAFPITERDNPDFPARYASSLNQIADGPFFRVAAANQDLGVDGQIQAVEDKLKARRLWQRLEEAKTANNEHEVEKITKELKYHEKVLQSLSASFRTRDGRLLSRGQATLDETLHDLAASIVDHVNHQTTTMELQDVVREGQPERIVRSPEPIRMATVRPQREPYGVTEGSDTRTMSVGEPNSSRPYNQVPDGHIRIFHPFTPGERGVGDSSELKNPGRYWTSNHQKAVNMAGEGGDIYRMDVPKSAFLKHYDIHGESDTAASAFDRVHAAQRGEGSVPDVHVESPDIKYGDSMERQQLTLAAHLGRGFKVSNETIRAIPSDFWPPETMAPMTIVDGGKVGIVRKLMSQGFYQVVGRPVDWLVRQPAFLYNYAVAAHDARKFVIARGIGAALDEHGAVDAEKTLEAQKLLVHDIAMERATRETTRFIHDPTSRSQGSVIFRNLAPFWFAQEQFYKRWGKLFGTYPEAFYKLSQTMNGLRSVGFVYTDQYGQSAFVYPGSQAMLTLLTKLPFFGSIPVQMGLSTEISQLNPSLSNGLAPWPSFGPIATIPTAVAGWMFPKYASGLAQAFQGPNASPLDVQTGRADRLLGMLLPSFISRMIEYANIDSTMSSESSTGPALFLSTEMMAAQQLEASGHGLTNADSANPFLKQQYLDRIANWTKNLILMRAWLGLIAPGTPNFAMNDKGLGNQLQALFATMPYDEAVTAFIKAHPNATADQIFQTSTSGVDQSGAYIPSTQSAAEFINGNTDFFKSYPQIAPWAIPAEAATGLFNATAYQDQKNLGLRIHLNLNDYYREIKYAEGANVYYPLEQLVWAAGAGPTTADTTNAQTQLGLTEQQAQERLGSQFVGASKQSITQEWDAWKQGFLKTHPIFESYYVTKGSEDAARRAAVVTQLQAAIKNGALPKSTWSTHVEELMWAYDYAQQFDQKTQGNSAYSAQRSQLKTQLVTWGNAFVAEHPELSPFWTGVLQKQVGG